MEKIEYGISDNRCVILDLCVKEDGFEFASTVTNALMEAESELREIEEILIENVETVKKLTPECDKLDYILAATSGAICSIIDIFMVGKPGESPAGDITDRWFEERTKLKSHMTKEVQVMRQV